MGQSTLSVLFFPRPWSAIVVGVVIMSAQTCSARDFEWQMRTQQETAAGGQSYDRLIRSETWSPATTAFIVCDVWDKHHCLNAVRRLEEFAPRLNQVLQDARRRGAIIIHSPSDCMPAYETHPARLRATAVPKSANQPEDIEYWCSRIPAEERAAYPIDQSDGGEDDDPAEHAKWAAELVSLGRNPGMPWKTQSPLIEIDGDRDFISDRGDEVWSILEQHGITSVVLTGVHTNMCVLGRPFGLRQMVRNGKNVVLMRDMTDCMYNPNRWPYVDHFTGNDLVISHVERFVCPTVTSDQVLDGEPFVSKTDTRTKRDVDAITPQLKNVDSLRKDWTVVALPATWTDVTQQAKTENKGVVWYRSSLRLSDRWLGNAEPYVLVAPPAKGTVKTWLNGQELKGVQPLCLACSEPEPVKFSFKPSAIAMNDVSLLVIRVQAESAEKTLLIPPELKAGNHSFVMKGQWQVRVGDDSAWSNIPLPAKFGTATDIFFEPTAMP